MIDVSVAGVDYTYPGGVEALRGVSLVFRQGERVAVIGRNGSGKTTLAKHLIGLLRPSAGSVQVGDWDTRTHTTAQLARRVGFLFQNPDEQIFSARVADEVAFGPRNLGLAQAEIDRRVDTALARCSMTHTRDTSPYELLPADRKWVALASVLALDTPILVLDEPTTGQDARGAERLGALVQDLAREGKSVITVTHDMDFCAENFERVVVMGGGRVLADDATRRILGRVDLLAETSIEPPHLTQIGLALGLPEPVMTLPEFLQGFRATVSEAGGLSR